jgi:hypothetical protein
MLAMPSVVASVCPTRSVKKNARIRLRGEGLYWRLLI